MSRSWAAELGAVGHTVNTINPGLVETDMLTAVGEKLGEGFEGALGVQKMLTPLENRIVSIRFPPFILGGFGDCRLALERR